MTEQEPSLVLARSHPTGTVTVLTTSTVHFFSLELPFLGRRVAGHHEVYVLGRTMFKNSNFKVLSLPEGNSSVSSIFPIDHQLWFPLD